MAEFEPMTREDKQTMCACGHKRAAHFGKGHEGDCAASTEGFQFCSCKQFREHQFKSEEEIEMAKKASKSKAPKGERKERVQLVYTFNIEKARELRDEKYKDKENLVASVLRALIGSGKEGYTFTQMAELTKGETGKLPTRAQFPLNKLKGEKVLKASKEKAEPKAAKPKKARTPRKPKAKPETAPAEAQEAAA